MIFKLSATEYIVPPGDSMSAGQVGKIYNEHLGRGTSATGYDLLFAQRFIMSWILRANTCGSPRKEEADKGVTLSPCTNPRVG